MYALREFEITLTFCFTPQHLGLAPHHSSAPRDPALYADFCARMVERYAPASAIAGAAADEAFA